MRSHRWMLAFAPVATVVALAGVSLGALAGTAPALAAPAPARLQQGVTVSGIVTNGQGVCFPDAVLVDCNGAVTYQLKGPGGAGFFAPHLNKWVSLNGAQQSCTGGTYLQVVTITPGQNPCGGGGQATPTAGPGATATPPPIPGATTVPGAAPNLALGKAVKASSSQAGFPPENAVDGNAASHWASNPGSDPWAGAQNVQWIYVDLGAPQRIERMRVLWGAQRHARTYGVYVWAERCRGWCFLGSTSYGDGGEDMWYTRGAVEGQQFMLYLQNPYLRGQHYELLEWELFGTGSGTPATNAAAGKPATALTQAAGNEPGKATDGDVNTEWRSQGGIPTWIYVDFGTAIEVDRAILRWTAGAHATRYTLYAWDDRYVPGRWTAIYNQTNGPGGDESVTFWSVRTRYVLLYMTAAAAGEVGLREFEVYNRATSSGLPTPPVPPGPPPLPQPFFFENDPGRTNTQPMQAPASAPDLMLPAQD